MLSVEQILARNNLNRFIEYRTPTVLLNYSVFGDQSLRFATTPETNSELNLNLTQAKS